MQLLIHQKYLKHPIKGQAPLFTPKVLEAANIANLMTIQSIIDLK